MNRELIFEEEAREKLKQGIDTLAAIMAVTLGPKGRNVGIDSSFSTPQISSDGSAIAKEIELKDQYANMAVSIAKEAIGKIQERCGDGSTTAIVLIRALVAGAVKQIASGASPILLKRGLDKGASFVLQAIEAMTKTLSNDQEITQIATAAAGGDPEVGNFIAKAFQTAGKTGVISIEEGKGRETTLSKAEGISFDRGYMSSYFCTDQQHLRIELSSPRILIVDKKISSIHEILPLLQASASSGSALLIIAEEIEADALSTLVVNSLRGTIQVAAVKSPSFGEARKALLEDLAALTGATVVSEEKGINLKSAGVEVLGSVAKALISKEETTLIEAAGAPSAIADRLSLIEAEIAIAESSYSREKLQERKAKLSGGVALIRVGGATEAEMKEKKKRFEDSLSLAKCALEEGVVPGGATAFICAREALSSLDVTAEEKLGIDLLYKALEAPFRQLLINAGYDPSSILPLITRENGFNVETGTHQNLMLSGIIDPTKVVKMALEHAVSTAETIFLCETLIGHVESE